jgi:biopolymer transport protein ExbD
MQPTSSVAKSSGVYRMKAEINVTPLVDVMLVLLIIFMVTAPMIAAGLHVSLPQAKAAEKLDKKSPVALTFSKDGHVTLDGQEYALDKIIDAVQARLGGDKTQAIHLRADKDASYGDVVGLMDQLASHGLTRLAVLTGPAAKVDPASPSPPAPDAAKAAPVASAPSNSVPVTAVPAQAPAPEGARP